MIVEPSYTQCSICEDVKVKLDSTYGEGYCPNCGRYYEWDERQQVTLRKEDIELLRDADQQKSGEKE